MDRYDLLVVGAGPAGLATAIAATLRGLSVAVVERGTPPLDKACGEGLMPPAVDALGRLGVALPAWGQHRLDGVRYLDGELVAEGLFPVGHGLGVRRVALAEGLRQRAEELGVELRFGTRLLRWARCAPEYLRAHVQAAAVADGPTGSVEQHQLEARLLVGADGLHSAVRSAAGLAGRRSERRRFGVRRHVATAPWSDLVEVHWADGVEAYVTPVGPELVGIALLWTAGAGASRAPGEDVFERLMVSFPQLTERLQGCAYASELQGAGPFRQRVQRCVADGVVLVGDAAGYLDPLTGDGVSLALRSALLLAQAVADGAGLAWYARRYRRLYRRYAAMASLALSLTHRPRLRRRAIALLARRPQLFGRLLAINADQPLASTQRSVKMRQPIDDLAAGRGALANRQDGHAARVHTQTWTDRGH